VNERKFLNASSGVDFTGVQVPLGIFNDFVHVVKLAGIPARVTDRANNRAVAPAHDPDHIIFTVSYEQVLLAIVTRESEVIRGAHADRFLAQEDFLYKLAFRCKRLNSVVDSIANVDKSIA